MTIILYLCENGLREYAENVSKKNNILLCIGNDSVEVEEYNNLSVTVVQKKELSSQKYDYLVILSRDMHESGEIEAMLVSAGIPRQKILEYCYYEKEPAKSPIELFYQEKISGHYDTFIFGMSHSYGGCLEPLLGGNAYKFSAPSMDLYYHYKVLCDVCYHYEMKKVKKLVFELPYYAFNYDISMCKNTFIKRMNYYYYFGDYHHFGESEEEKQQIFVFETLNELCEKPVYASQMSAVKENVRRVTPQKGLRKKCRKIRYGLMTKKSHVWTEEEKHAIEQLHPHVWYQYHEKTIEENRRIWEKIKLLLNRYENIEWKVIVFPFNPLFIKKNEDAISTMKCRFIEELDVSEGKLIDYFDCYLDREDLFEDECHLNIKGAYDFSKRIRNVI